MIVRTLFQHEGRFAPGEMEIKLMPGIPVLHVVGQPDAHIRECGMRLKSALRSSGHEWPQGHQIVVNLRPSYFRKSSSGIDLAVALGFLALTGQLSAEIESRLKESVVYGEVTLDGRVFAPPDLGAALQVAPQGLITGEAPALIRDGDWWSMGTLKDENLKRVTRSFAWESFWRRPELPELRLHSDAAEALCLVTHMGLNVLVAGPQGSGKSTWARALYALSPVPHPPQMAELQALFGEEALSTRWRPFEKPHHSITPLAMIGGGAPLTPGVISRAHGGVLVMDEFLEFHSQVLEALREPIENGFVEHARRGERARFPAGFQLVGTTNLCPCGKLNLDPKVAHACSHSLTRCRSVCARLSGPIMDRFDLVIFSHEWLKNGEHQPLLDVQRKIDRLAEFARERGSAPEELPAWIRDLEVSHRRRKSLLRVARGLADLDACPIIQGSHFQAAYTKVIDPMTSIRQLFA